MNYPARLSKPEESRRPIGEGSDRSQFAPLTALPSYLFQLSPDTSQRRSDLFHRSNDRTEIKDILDMALSILDEDLLKEEEEATLPITRKQDGGNKRNRNNEDTKTRNKVKKAS